MITYTVTVDNDGTRKWYNKDRLFHRSDGPAIERADGDKEWYQNGKLHREDGPAIECISGFKLWYHNGKKHREDGPALEYSSGNKEWYLNDELLTEEEFINARMNPVELTIAEIEKLLGYPVKVVK